MSKLILIKHAKPLIDPSKPSSDWRLSNDGREAARRLFEPMRTLAVSHVYSSDEPKAFETAQILADGLNVECEHADDLHEHDRSNVPHMRTPDFISAMSLFFKEHDRLTLGRESAAAATKRIEGAVTKVLTAHKDENIAIVTHGTVLALFVAQRVADVDPFQVWRRMGLPSYVVFDRETMQVLEEVDRV